MYYHWLSWFPMPKEDIKLVAKSGTFSSTAKHRRTVTESASTSASGKTSSKDVVVKQKGPHAPRRRSATAGARKSKYEPSIDNDKSEEEEEVDDDDERPVCFELGCSAKVEEKMVKSTFGSHMCDISKCNNCEERKCPDHEWSAQCATCDEHGFCPDCEDDAELCEWCGSCSECRPDSDYCCESRWFRTGY